MSTTPYTCRPVRRLKGVKGSGGSGLEPLWTVETRVILGTTPEIVDAVPMSTLTGNQGRVTGGSLSTPWTPRDEPG